MKTVVYLQTPSYQQRLMVPDAAAVSSAHKGPQELAFSSEEHPTSTPQQHGTSSRLEMKTEKQTSALPPWRDPDRCPKDTVRFNYLDNLDPIEQALRA